MVVSPALIVCISDMGAFDRTLTVVNTLRSGWLSIRLLTFRLDVWQLRQLWVVRFLLLFLFLVELSGVEGRNGY